MRDEINHKQKAFVFIFILAMLTVGVWECASQIPKDKQLHFAIGSYIGAWSMALPPQEGIKPVIYGLSGAIVLGGSKELYDMAGGGTVEWADFGATLLGAAVSIGVICGVKAIIKRRKIKHNHA